jgi:hypothetical protein
MMAFYSYGGMIWHNDDSESCGPASSDMERVRNQEMAKKPAIQAGDYAAADDGLSANRVFVSMAKTMNLGNYESFRVEYGAGRALQPGESHEEARQGLVVEVLSGVSELVDLIKSSTK